MEQEPLFNIHQFKETQFYKDLYQEALEEWVEAARQQGRRDEALIMVVRVLKRRFKQELSADHEAQIEALSLPVLEALSEALLDFEGVEDLTGWLAQQEGEGVE